MRVRVKCTSYKGIPPEQLSPGDSEDTVVHLAYGSELEVHAISMFRGHVFLFVIDTMGEFYGFYNWQFDIIDGSIPTDWMANQFEVDGTVITVFGPQLVAGSVEKYSDFVESNPVVIDNMWDRHKRLQADKREGES